MYCPNCGQERISTETSFCSRCGFLLTGTAEILKTGGVIPGEKKEKRLSKIWRNRGFKKGLFVFLLTFIIVPIVTMFAISLRIGPFFPAIVMILLAGGGLLKMVYALMFEAAESIPDGERSALIADTTRRRELPPQQFDPASAWSVPRAGNWRDTNDLEPASVTENTTRHLEK